MTPNNSSNSNGNVQGKKILVVDDDDFILKLVEQAFARAGNEIYTAANGLEGLQIFYKQQPDLVILDIMMPVMDGLEACRFIRQSSNVPVIVLTALGREEDVIRGLSCGADDYVTKPFSLPILMARAASAVRRAALPPVVKTPAVYDDGYLAIDLNQGRVLRRGEPVKLSAKEHLLLSFLFKKAGQILTFEEILKQVWGMNYCDNLDYVHVYIWHLRRKIEKDPKNPKYILTEHGLGYRFEKAKALCGL